MNEFNNKKAKSKEFIAHTAQIKIIEEGEEDQRLDNFLLAFFKGIPKTRVYRMIRKGEVRINKKRAEARNRLCVGDKVRIPPYYANPENLPGPVPKPLLDYLKSRVLFENEEYVILNKPSGYAVHGGSTIKIGIVEAMQQLYSHCPQFELVHRLDRETSGCLIFAKKKKILREFHELLREGSIKKMYYALLKGRWRVPQREVIAPLKKSEVPQTEKRLVRVSAEGKAAHTTFSVLRAYKYCTLVEAELHTGRTHQIRVHAAHIGHPVAMDDRYGDNEFNRTLRQTGLKRLFLHAHLIEFILPGKHEKIRIVAPLDEDLQQVLEQLQQ